MWRCGGGTGGRNFRGGTGGGARAPCPSPGGGTGAILGLSARGGVAVAGNGRCDGGRGQRGRGWGAVRARKGDAPPYPTAVPDAVIGRLGELRPLIESW